MGMGELRDRVAAATKQRAERETRQAKLQKWQIITSWTTIATVIVATVAIILSYAGLKQQEGAAATQDQESRYSSISQLSLDLDKTIADHPRLISCFQDVDCKAKPALTAQEKQQAEALAIYIVDFYQYLYAQLRSLGAVPRSGLFLLREDAIPGKSDENWINWSETIVSGFKYSSMVCQALINGAAAYEQGFVHAVAITQVCPKLSDPGPSAY
jgi:hypothetical protein